VADANPATSRIARAATAATIKPSFLVCIGALSS
jgi:hypothetical protein